MVLRKERNVDLSGKTKEELEFLIDELIQEVEEKDEEIQTLTQTLNEDFVDLSIHNEVLEVCKRLEAENEDLKDVLDTVGRDVNDILRKY